MGMIAGFGFVGGLVFVLILMFVISIALIAVVIYCTYKILDHFKFENKVLGAIIPIYQQYALASVAAGKSETIRLSLVNKDIESKYFKLGFLVSIVCPMIPVIGALLGLAVTIIWWATLFTYLEARIKKISIDEVDVAKQVLFGFLSFIGLIACLTWIKNKEKSN